MRRCAATLAKVLKDDFPRTLSDFERVKIANKINQTLLALPREQQAQENSQNSTQPVLPDNVILVLNNLLEWPLQTACSSLSRIIAEAPQSLLNKVSQNETFMKFLGSVQPCECSQDTLAQLAHVVHAVNPSSAKLFRLVEEAVLHRDLRYFSKENLLKIATIAANIPGMTRALLVLDQHATNELDLDLMLALMPYNLSRGKKPILPCLVPCMKKTELIRFVEMLEKCDFPDLITFHLNMAVDELTRLSFRRLVNEDDRKALLKALFRIKSKLDSLVCIEGNPFYSKQKKLSENYMRKVLKTLSSDFHNAAISLPLPEASSRMLSLLGLNSLQLGSVDLIANRLSAFGDNLLAPSVLSASDFTGVLYAITSHPQSWKRRDRFRASIAGIIARNFSAHISNMSSQHLISCVCSLMKIHNKDVRAVVGSALDSLNPASLASAQLVQAAKVFATLLKHETPTATLPALIRILDHIKVEALSTPQLVELLVTCKEARVVHRADQIAHRLQERISGGSISPTNVARTLQALGYLQIRRVGHLISSLLQCLPEPAGCHPRLAARLISGIATTGIPNPEAVGGSKSVTEELLLAISGKEEMQEVVSQRFLASDLNKSLTLLGDPGYEFRRHLKEIPCEEAVVVTSNKEAYRKMNDEIISSCFKPSISHEEWKGQVPIASELVGNILGALIQSAINPETGGFEISGIRTWRNSDLSIQVSIIKASQCSRDDPRHILGPATCSVAIDRTAGWKVIVLAEDLLEVQRDTEVLKKRIRRAKIICKGDDAYEVLVDQLKLILNDDEVV